ncbi:MAG: radical SAM protein [Candidatus Omnitrophota bacterium]|nr:radical SAM protein [Candidatus Omnitrophota bacterium]
MVERNALDSLKMIAWEVTRSCNLACSHCRASSKFGPYQNELTTQECFQLIDELAAFGKPEGDGLASYSQSHSLLVILTGGEPLLREDIFQIIEYGHKQGLKLVMAPNGTLLNEENVKKIIASGIKRISVSLDGPDEASHDQLRHVPGAFKRAQQGIERAKSLGLEFQINSTISKRNIKSLAEIIKLAKDLGAKAHHIFLLVPTGRAKEMVNEELSAQEYEEALKLFSQEKKNSPLDLKATCAPHFNRILLQEHADKACSLRGRGCMGGVSFCFISHTGDLQPCGYLEIKCGNVRDEGFKKAWLTSEVFNNLRDFSKYKGKCGVCEFQAVCGGCRARAFAKTRDYLAEEPYCTYEPLKRAR